MLLTVAILLTILGVAVLVMIGFANGMFGLAELAYQSLARVGHLAARNRLLRGAALSAREVDHVVTQNLGAFYPC